MQQAGPGAVVQASARRAVDMLEPTTDRLVASRGLLCSGLLRVLRRRTRSARRRRSGSPSSTPATPRREERACALVAQTQLHNRNDRFAAALDAANRRHRRCQSRGLSSNALILGPEWQEHLFGVPGPPERGVCGWGRAHLAGAKCGHVRRCTRSRRMARADTDGLRSGRPGDVPRSRRLTTRPLPPGSSRPPARCGDPIVTGLTWQGRFDEAETLLAELRELGLGEGAWRGLRGELSLARGDVEAATLVMPTDRRSCEHPAVVTPTEGEVLRELQIAALREDQPQVPRGGPVVPRSAGRLRLTAGRGLRCAHRLPGAGHRTDSAPRRRVCATAHPGDTSAAAGREAT